ncbi:tetratricopeptide repeat protein [Caenimonas terrae]|uniref:Tetratricopeptide repeat protein n=1 Tax=Caenimonas terrae TaxID=696074 RepID=A0ABW0N9T2_9BURK
MSTRATPAWASLLVALLLLAGAVRADTLDDSLRTVWESLWDQGGTARQTMRWKSPVAYRIHGPDSARHVQHLRNALAAAGDAAGIALVDVSQQADAASTAGLDIEVVSDDDLGSDACVTEYLQVRNWLLERVHVRMRSGEVWRCAYHEAVHAMGIAGHPSGRTVLSYFPYRRDRLMELDQLMLAAWYSARLPPGSTPLAALVVLSDAVLAQQDLGLSPQEARERTAAFRQARLRDMEALAEGRGEIPAILLRSGRAHVAYDAPTQGRYAWHVGVAYLLGAGVEPDPAAAARWFEQGARKGFAPAQVMWARALRDGTGVAPDPVAAYAWFALAANGGNGAAPAELAQLEQSLDAGQLEQARNRIATGTTP